MFLLILYFPLIAGLSALILGQKLGKHGVILHTLICMFLSVCIAFWIFFKIVVNDTLQLIVLSPWLVIGNLYIQWSFLFDPLACIMIIVVILVSFCVHLFAVEYMYYDPHLPRFLGYLSLFTFFMLILVTIDNWLLLVIAWDGIGLCSYLLINFWHTRIAANKAAMKALIMNKIGDVALLLALILFSILYFILDFTVINCSSWLIRKTVELNTWIFLISFDYFSIIFLLVILGVCAKSAQIGLHTWLPDAMEGPTPVSALIHAATMVTAGIFLLLRLVHLLKYDQHSLLVISFIGGITSFIAATIGLFQNDIKKVIAYSTCSQLGYMMLSCGLNNYSGALFHLMNHAFFKALLFLSAGAIIHSMLDQQDIRRMGMLLKYLPVSYIMILIGSLTIMGIPFLTGFYSKDFILEYVYSSNMFISFFLYWLAIMSAALTSLYSIKLLFMTFYNVHNSYFNILYKKKTKKIVIHESKILILIALIILFLGSIFVGFIFKDLFIGMGTDVWTNTLDTESYKDSFKIFEVEFIPVQIKLIPIIFTMYAIILCLFFFKFYTTIMSLLFKVYYIFIKIVSINKNKNMPIRFFMKKLFFFKKIIYNGYYFNEIYNYFLFKNKNISYSFFKNVDKGIIEYIGHVNIVTNINKILYLFSKKNKNRLDYIVFVMLLGLIIIFFIIIFCDIISNYKVTCFLLILVILYILDILKKK